MMATATSKRVKQKPARPTAKTCRAPKYGGKCPQCGRGKLDYNGLIELFCPACGYVAGAGGFS